MKKDEPTLAETVILHGIRNTTMLKDPSFRSIYDNKWCWWTVGLCALALCGIVVVLFV